MYEKGQGFTLIEIMLVVAGIAILAGIAVVAINPAHQLAAARNNVRRADISVVWSAAQRYVLDNHGLPPSQVPSGTLADCLENPTSAQFTVCRTNSCALVLTELLQDSKYLIEIPVDPNAATDDYSGYNMIRDTEHSERIVVCAPGAEDGETIYISK